MLIWFGAYAQVNENRYLNRPGLFFWVPSPVGGGGGGGRKVPTAHNSKTVHGIETKFGRIIENHKLINLV